MWSVINKTSLSLDSHLIALADSKVIIEIIIRWGKGKAMIATADSRHLFQRYFKKNIKLNEYINYLLWDYE